MALPKYFYDFSEPIDFMGQPRWVDPYADLQQIDDGTIITPEQFKRLKQRNERDRVYAAWLKRFGITPRTMLFQAIRVLRDQHSDPTRQDWWREYKDSVFRVFVNPEIMYDGKGHKQFYVLCPEDSYLVNCHLAIEQGVQVPKRNTFKWISPHKELRRARVIPVECCHHLRNETTQGAPEFLSQL